MAQRWDATFVSLAAISLLWTAGGVAGVGLYSASDQVTLLDIDNLDSILYNSSNAWLVEFYASWCGHCKNFAPVWKALANDIKEWKPAVDLAAINCANLKNAKICRRFGVSSYPTVKVFKAFSKPFFKGEDFDEDDSKTTLPRLRHAIINSLEEHGENVWPPACPPLEPTSLAEVQNFFAGNNVQYLALIVEQESSYLGREVILDMLQYDNIAVRRVLSSEENLTKTLGVQEIPSCYLYFANNTQRKITVKMQTRSFYTYYLQQLPGVTRGAFRQTAPDLAQTTTAQPWRDFNSSKIYMADLESALYYSLNVEVQIQQELSGKTLTALKQFIGVLTKFFPGRPFVMKLLEIINSWLTEVDTTPISYSAFADVLSNKKERTGAFLPNGVNWVGCRGSRPQFRGYPCSVWTLFHLLTVQAANYNESMAQREETAWTDPREILYTLRQYVRHFFSCRECAIHFEAMAKESMDQVDSFNKAILWLWSRHNQVNNRLAGAQSEDPKFPKLQWPAPDMCAECHSEFEGEHLWITDEVLKFLKAHYSPQNIDNSYLNGVYELLNNQTAREATQQEQEKDGPEKEDEEDRRNEDDEADEEEEEAPVRNDGQRENNKSVTGIRRDGSQKRTFIRGKHIHRRQEDVIVDLDSFVNEQYKSQALRDRAENERANHGNDGVHRPQQQIQSNDNSKSLDYTVFQSRLHKRAIGKVHHSGVIAEATKKNWLYLLGKNFSRVDISLCVLLYFLSSMCLLSMYLYFKMRFRWRKTGFASA
ncbi:sulfhydryl oxidase 1 isoform X1 [Scyliorhinus canicula]|uniref:sulfhydryl oxidase 1 isoform X1 n=1 Tax=Scyliorhinus canicula TaxID=7830 RepID=UPI0018F67EE4|nr:sulfhydryl oxidase 1 isoform X1 [Scyliorhinus canicula]